MREGQDAFGQLFRDQLDGRARPAVVERDDGFVEAIDASDYFTDFGEWPAHVRRAMRRVRGRVLDIGCGAGRHALYLQNKGLDIVGIDESPLAVELCRLRGLRQVEVLPITRVSSSLGRFDTLLMLGNNFGLFGSPQKTRRLLKRFDKITGPQGRLIVEAIDPYATSDPDHLKYHQNNRDRRRMTGQIRIRVRYKRLRTSWFDLLLVSQDEMTDILVGTGWFIRQFIGGANYSAVIEKAAPH